MTHDDAARWDERYRDADPTQPAWPERFASVAGNLPTHGHALDIACGTGSTVLFLGGRGLSAHGIDVSSVAIATASKRAASLGLEAVATFAIADLDDGLPDGPPLDLLTCHLFRDASLDEAMVQRLAPGGVLAIAALSEVGAEPGPFRCRPGELTDAFGSALTIVHSDESDGVATLIGRRAA